LALSRHPQRNSWDNEKVLNWGATGGGKYKIYEFEKFAPQIWKVKFGDGSIEYPKDSRNYLSRMALGKCVAGYWLKQRYKYSLTPK
jgi:hypothetical protein